MPTGPQWRPPTGTSDDETADDVHGHAIPTEDQGTTDLEAEGHSRTAAEELVRQADEVQDLDVQGHGILQN